jgi:hypothetical protein
MQASRSCSRCGANLDAQAAFCSRCGQPVDAATPPPRTYRSVREQIGDVQRRLPGNLATIPIELLVAVALMAASAIWLCVTVALHVHDVASLFEDSDGAGAPGLALYALATLVILLAFCGWLGFLAWRVTERDARARAVAYVPLTGYGLAVLFSNADVDGSPGTRAALHSLDSHGAMPIVTMLMCWAAALILAVTPRIRGFFGTVGPTGQAVQRFDPVRVARDVLIAFASGVAAVGVMYLVAHLIADPFETSIGVKVLVIGILFVAVAAGVIASLNRLVGGDPFARAAVSGLVLAYLVLMAIVEGQDLALLLLLFIGLGGLGYLWLHPAVRARYGARPQSPNHSYADAPRYGVPHYGPPHYGPPHYGPPPAAPPNPPAPPYGSAPSNPPSPNPPPPSS